MTALPEPGARDSSKSIWVGKIPKNAKAKQVLGAFNAQGYRVSNQIVLKRLSNGEQWTVAQLATAQAHNNALRKGMTFNNTALLVKPYKKPKKKSPTSTKPKPSGPKKVGRHVTALLDLSGSMSGARIKAATEGIQLLFNNLDDEDWFFLFGFNKTVEQLCYGKKGQLEGKLSGTLRKSVNKVGGGTAMWDALDRAVREQKECQKAKSYIRKKRILLLTDGEDTRSHSSAQQVINAVHMLGMSHKPGQDFRLVVIAVGEARQVPELKTLCKPPFCRLVEVGNVYDIAMAVGSAYTRK